MHSLLLTVKGSGGGGGIGGWTNNNYGTGSSSGGGGSLSTAGVVGILVASIGLVLALCIVWQRKTKREAERLNAMKRFPDRVVKAKARYDGNQTQQQVLLKEKPLREQPPKSGEYNVVYTDRGTTAKGIANLIFTDLNDGRGYKISGTYVDKDGESRIKEGFVRFDGTDAFWVEEYVSGSDIGMNVLNEGVFDFQMNKFDGRWYSSTGYHGEFKKFELTASNCETTTDMESHAVVDDHGTPIDIKLS
jgi:hypothetical protein